MLTYANTPLLLEDAEGLVSRWIGQHLSLEDLGLFGAVTPAVAGNRSNSQGGNSHVVSLPVPNYPAPPRLRINSLYWPTGAARFGYFLGLATDSQLDAIRAVIEDTPPTLKAAQLVIGDSEYQGTIAADGYQSDSHFRQALSTKMWMLPPRCLSAAEPASGSNDVDRVWIVPLVDERYFWQTKATPSYLYGNFYVTESAVPTSSPPTTTRSWRIQCVGRYSRISMPGAFAIDGSLLLPATASVSASSSTSGDANTNAAWEVAVTGAAGGTFTLTVTIPSSLVTAETGAVTQTTAPIPWDASPEEVESALHDLLLGRARWESLIENLSTAVDTRIGYVAPAARWGYPDRVELDRRFESIGMVMDAVAHSTGMRFVRNISGTLSLMTALQSDRQVESNLDPQTVWRQVAGRETVTDGNWSQGQYVPASIDVIFRDLTRSTRVGTWRAADLSLPTNEWRTDGGRLRVNVPLATADTDQFSELAGENSPSYTVAGWTETIHTPTMSNTGRIADAGDNYSLLAGSLAAAWYDWKRRLFDIRFASVMPWRMTGFDDHVEFSMGQRLSDPTTDEHGSPNGYGGYLAGTRVVSMPMNFGCSDSLNQIGTLCSWTEDMIQGEIREAIGPVAHPRLYPDKARCWVWLPEMELQGAFGEARKKLSSHRRAATVMLRSIDASALPGTYFQAAQFFCDSTINWLDCSRYCGTTDWIWNAPSLPSGWSPDPLTTCGSICHSSKPSTDGEYDGEVVTTYCVDNGKMS